MRSTALLLWLMTGRVLWSSTFSSRPGMRRWHLLLLLALAAVWSQAAAQFFISTQALFSDLTRSSGCADGMHSVLQPSDVCQQRARTATPAARTRAWATAVSTPVQWEPALSVRPATPRNGMRAKCSKLTYSQVHCS
jgi:hypothetical protein